MEPRECLRRRGNGLPDRKGRFTVVGLPSGTYRVVAREEVLDGQWEDPDFLESLLKDAARVTLAEAASDTIKLRVELTR